MQYLHNLQYAAVTVLAQNRVNRDGCTWPPAGHSKVQPAHLLWALTVYPETLALRPDHMRHEPPLRAAVQQLCAMPAATYSQVRCVRCHAAAYA